jgi:hypothetical protein
MARGMAAIKAAKSQQDAGKVFLARGERRWSARVA